MAIEPVTETIGEHTYTVYPMTTKKGTRALMRLINQPDPTDWSDETIDYFEKLFLANCAVSGGSYSGSPQLSEVYELHFVDRYMEWLKWLRFCIKANFGRFFDEAKGKMSAAPSASV